MGARYDRIGSGYAVHRRPDPRIEAVVRAALGSARTVLDVGAGAGSYEPAGLAVVALDPSRTMLRQRGPGTGPAVVGVAEALPFPDGAFDATLAVLTHHHWPDVSAGFAELRRVARRHVCLTWDAVAVARADFWLVRDYFPAFQEDLLRLPALDAVTVAFPAAEVRPVPVPHDCTDGFMAAYWRRPEAYLDPGVRGAISSFAVRSAAEVAPGLARLAGDLASGAWARRNRALLDRDTLDLGYRIVVAGG